jgi:hypothetical protein
MLEGTTSDQKLLFEEVKKYLLSVNIAFEIDDEQGDYLFLCVSDKGNQFTIDVCGEYVEFYSDRTHNLINYAFGSYVEDTLTEINRYKTSI